MAKKKRPSVRVRMYRQGLGDCFLLTFGIGAESRHMLIDCGTLGAATTGVKLKDVAASVRATTDGRLDLLVATHEHWDHVRAFKEQEDVFKTFDVRNVWLAWTENPDDPTAKDLKKYARDLGATLAAVASGPSATGGEVRQMLEFFGVAGVLGAGKFSASVDEAMDFVRTRPGAAVSFLEPGPEPITPDFIPGFRFYVLGPPRDTKALADLGEHGSSELYGVNRGLRAAAAFHEAAGPLDADRAAACEAEMPFDYRLREPLTNGRGAEWYERYSRPADGWRTIDEEWLGGASDLALQLDSRTNNTSLALAIERIADGKVLLFPADAQQGNWLSWHAEARTWKVKRPGGGTSTVRAPDLLARTVFYKVGHHASHNATARGKGLEMMTNSSELTAFIPVDRAVAQGRKPKGSWKMPARPLYLRLLELCEGRVVRSDTGWAADFASAADKTVEKEFKGMGTAAQWTAWKKSQAKAGHVTLDPKGLYIDYTLA